MESTMFYRLFLYHGRRLATKRDFHLFLRRLRSGLRSPELYDGVEICPRSLPLWAPACAVGSADVSSDQFNISLCRLGNAG